jgi:choline dehydrogenase-like flavoprotein
VFVDFREVAEGQQFQADVCIAGAGAAGITLATELSAAGLEVCLLESGGLEMDADTQKLYEAGNVGITRLPATATRLRFFGGSTNHWNGKCARLDPGDFRERAWVPDSGWPITRLQLDPFYDRAQPLLDLAPSRTGAAVAEEFGVPRPPLDPSVASLFAWQLSPPTRFGEKFRSQLKSSPRAHVVLYANVVNVQTNASADHVLHLDIRSLSGRSGRVVAGAYVLSCGGIENSRLLLSSDSVDARGLGNARDLVGRYFIEHLRNHELIALERDPYAIQRIYNVYQRREGDYLLGLALSEQVQQREGILNAGFFPNFERTETSATVTAGRLARGLVHGQLPDDPAASVGRVLRNLDEIVINVRRKLLRPGSNLLTDDLSIMVIDTEQAPNRQSRILLSSERDALGMRRAAVDWRMNELDRRSVLRALDLFAAQLWLCHRARIHVPDSMDNELQEWVQNFKDVAHHIGGTRMADDPQRGVVDRNCRVHGVDNLFIAGSSVFPTSGQTNPTMTIVALALRLADELKRSLKGAGGSPT